jgi:hypothetical protein
MIADDIAAWLAQTVTSPVNGEPGWYVPACQDWCPRCGDTNYTDTRQCITCTDGDTGFRDGLFTEGWPGITSTPENP